VRTIWKNIQGIDLPEAFNVMTYHEAMSRFGSDKPDTRFGLEIINLSGILGSSTAANQTPTTSVPDLVLEGIVVRKVGDPGFRKASQAVEAADPSTEHITLSETNRETWLLQSMTASQVYSDMGHAEQTAVNKALKLKVGDQVWVNARSRVLSGGSTVLGRQRLQIFELAQSRGDFVVTTDPHFLWVTEFPLFTRHDADKEHLAQGRWSSSHHPFTAPMWEDIDALNRGEIEKVHGQHYDLVLNGVEIGGGSVRIHDAAMQEDIFTNVLRVCIQIAR